MNKFTFSVVVVVALTIVSVWPPEDDRSLAVKLVNWIVDPLGALPVLPPQLALGRGDDPEAVEARDLQTQQYDALYLKGGWTRRRLELKVARDPINPATERQLLLVIGVVTALFAWRALRAGR
jgi:hypothetical protein